MGPGFHFYRDKHLSGRGKDIPLCAGCPDWKYRSWDHNYWKVVRNAEASRAAKLARARGARRLSGRGRRFAAGLAVAISLKLSGYLFTGPFPLETTIRANQHPVVFAVIEKSGPGWSPTFRVLDVGFSEDTGINFATHPASSSWGASGDGAPSLYLFDAPRSKYSVSDRRQIAEEIRQRYNPPNDVVEG